MFDVLIQNGRVIDGTGNPWFWADVAIQGDRIAAIIPRHPSNSSSCKANAHELVDASDCIVCPGFIDIMSHSIIPLFADGRSLSKVTQGVTTEIMGEGWTPAPFGGQMSELDALYPRSRMPGEWGETMRSWSRFGDWLNTVAARGVSVNIGSFLGGSTVRAYAKGLAMGEPSPEELKVMRRITQEAMEDGAFGVAYALIYPPDTYTTTAELVEVCKVVAAQGGIYISHIRSEADGVLAAVDEALEIGKQANLPVQLYHLKVMGKKNWSYLPQVLQRIRQARATGQDVTADMYPYTGSAAGLLWGLPPWVAEGGHWLDTLRNSQSRAQIRQEVLHPTPGWEAVMTITGADYIFPVDFHRPENRHYIGLSLAEIAHHRKQHWVDTFLDLLIEEEQEIMAFWLDISEENLEQQLREPWVMISSDAGGLDPAWSDQVQVEHPRAFGTFPRVLGHYVRDRQLLTLEDAIRRMTSLPANRLGLFDRGILRARNFADITMFNPMVIADKATFKNPHQCSVGISDVWVNGVRTLSQGLHTHNMPGRVVRALKQWLY